MLKALLNKTGPIALNVTYLESLVSYEVVWRVVAIIALLAGGFLLWVTSLSRLDISYAYAVACSSALIVTLFSVLFLNEAVSPRMWSGTVLIVLGTMLLGPRG
jgi:drug/metabolite transporter (DMT)-like permease